MRIINTHREPVPPDDPMTAEEILDLCCTSVPFDPCAKAGRVSDYDGAEQKGWNFDPDQALEQARADNPGKRIISVVTEGVGNRPGQPCGKKYEDWTGKFNCCDFVEPLAWDSENSVDVIADYHWGRVFVQGGIAPYHWQIRGQGMSFDSYNIRETMTYEPYVDVYASEFACGHCPIEVTDGCSLVIGGVRSSNGGFNYVGFVEPSVIASPQLSSLGAIKGNVYEGPWTTGDKSRWSATKRYWIGDSPAAVGESGIPHNYDLILSSYGPWGLTIPDCLAGMTVVDNLVGAFIITAFIGCVESSGVNWSHHLGRLDIWEWRC